MSGVRAKLTVTLLAALLLCGCSAHTLASREIVRAVLFGAEGSVCLLLEGREEDAKGYRVVEGQGATAAQALHQAEQQLAGQAYYGLMDVAVLPSTVSFVQARELGELLYDKAQPAPEAGIFAADWSAETAPALYDRLRGLQNPHCGLERLFEQQDCCWIPFSHQDTMGCLFLPRDGNPLRVSREEQAQLLLLLCGQSDRLEMTFADGTARLMADGRVTVQAEPERTVVTVTLRDVKLAMLTPTARQETVMSQLMTVWQQLFRQLAAAHSDPFRLDFWASARFGPGAKAAAPVLAVSFE